MHSKLKNNRRRVGMTELSGIISFKHLKLCIDLPYGTILKDNINDKRSPFGYY